ncbi:class F sortase [Saccharopolyspora sp. WRP15-2]|uniref:Class F sortase n=1 Tax=Saccharopolyspora oryzae TaxID=2997343 RepID=A0ABT4USK9_9PSEU|nr:class F sortase [Saccharopolyspora oryzae]MDA3624704.1 class F sortase [Saccharopolyspora oryzae]
MTAAAGLGYSLSGPSLPHSGTVPPAHSPSDPVEKREVLEPVPDGEVPQRIRMPSVGVDAPVQPVLLGPDQQLDVPESPAVVGWWSAGAAPGSRAGTVVLAGHVDTRSAGPGAFFEVADLNPGEIVEVISASRTTRYRVEALRSYPKDFLPMDVFERTGRPRLVLITCGGRFDDGIRQYEDNVVAYAVPA